MSECHTKTFVLALGPSTSRQMPSLDNSSLYPPIPSTSGIEATSWTVEKFESSDSSQYCRICAKPSDYLIPIYDGQGLENKLEHKIKKYLPIKISQTDTLPILICYQCASALMAWDKLYNISIDSEKKLKAIFKEYQEKQDAAERDDQDNGFSFNDTVEPDMTDSDDEPLIQQKQKLVLEKSHSKPIKKKILSKTKRMSPRTEKTATQPKDTTEERRLAAQLNSIGSDDFEIIKPRCLSQSVAIFQCDICKKEFDKKVALVGHKSRVHDRIIKATCLTCNKNFTDRSNYRQHLLIHTGLRSYVCQICGKSFVQPQGLRMHMTSHNDEAAYVCHICSKSFRRKQHFELHMVKHVGKKMHQCETCGKAFLSKNELRMHSWIHKNEFPYKCQFCEKGFNQSFGLKSHLRNHHTLVI